MKIYLLFALVFFFTTPAFSQIDIFGKIKEKVEERADKKTDEAIDKGLDEVEEGVTKDQQESEEQQQEVDQDEKADDQVKVKQEDKKAGLKTYSKYDFIAGEKIIFFDDFSQDAISDFPLKWNTNSGGEVQEIEGMGKWFTMNWGGTFYPEFSEPLPENFTIEFDLLFETGETYPPHVTLDIYSKISGEPMDNLVPGNGGVSLSFTYDDVQYKNWVDQNFGEISNSVTTSALANKSGYPVRISIMAQKQRIRLWIDEKKIIDIPRMLPAGLTFDRIRFYEGGTYDETSRFFIKNFRVAAGVPDMRSKLITEGKLVIHGIYFDSGSDKIRPESYGTLKEIANILKENEDVKVSITGHTDSDGSDESNLELSKKRSLSVKNALAAEFGIDVSRMETDGKGETQPMDVNTTPEGKANNRRVEFIKL